MSVWVKRLGAGKLDPHADEGHFVGYDEEAEGYWVYWALKQRVSIEWDIYVDKGTTLSPGDVVFEGEWDVPTGVISKPAILPNNPKQITNDSKKSSNKINDLPQISTTEPLTHPCKDSLVGLPQYGLNTYGQGKCKGNTHPTTFNHGLEQGGAPPESALLAITDQLCVENALKSPDAE